MLKLLPPLGAVAVSVLLFGSPVRAQNAAGEPSPDPSPPTADSKADPAVDPPKRQASDQPPTGVNKVRNFIETNPIVQSFKGDGFYPRVGGLSQGSGLAGGAGYRQHLDWAYVDVSGAISTKAYRG